jgi:predicted NBD/HSP70 family sugar kinase
VTPLEHLVAALDVGGTTTRGVIARAAGPGPPLVSTRAPTVTGEADVLVDVLGGTVSALASAAGVEIGELGAVGIGIPGIVDPVSGRVRHAVNLGVGDAPLYLADRLGASFGIPVVVDNDANLAALGAAAVLDHSDDLAYLSIGTGVAVGLVLDGRIRRGWRGAAGEIGHLPVDPDGPVCRCGQRGCLEAVASGAALARQWPADDGLSPATALFAAAAAGSAPAIAVRDRFAGHVAQAVAVIGLAVDPALVVLGGGVGEVGAPLLAAVRAALRARAGGSPLLADLDLAGRLALAPDGVAPGLVGAVELARSRVPAAATER